MDQESGGVLYPSNVLEGFGLGALLDLRVRFAHDYLMHSQLLNTGSGIPTRDVAAYALELADELLTQGRAAGWVQDLPEDSELDGQLRAQAARTAKFQVLQQLEGQRAASDEAGRVVQMQGRTGLVS